MAVKTRDYCNILLAVSCYWGVSISLVFLNKHLLSGAELELHAPMFVTWYQCLVSFVLCMAIGFFKPGFDPTTAIDFRVMMRVMPLSLIFVGMTAFNNLSLMYLDVAFYFVGRSLSTVFNLLLSFLVLGQIASGRTITCCALIIFGFFLGVDAEDDSGTLSYIGVLFGILSALFVALNAIFTGKTLPLVNKDIWQLTLYNNLNAVLLFVPLIVLSGELTELEDFPNLFSADFWIPMTISGLFGFLMGYVTGWQIQATTPLTHNISGTAKAAFQTVIAVIWWAESKTFWWWASNIMVLFGSGLYTYVKGEEMKRNRITETNERTDKSSTEDI